MWEVRDGEVRDHPQASAWANGEGGRPLTISDLDSTGQELPDVFQARRVFIQGMGGLQNLQKGEQWSSEAQWLLSRGKTISNLKNF